MPEDKGVQPTVQPQEASDLMILSDCLEKMRSIVNDKDINNAIQDKDFFQLAERMAKLNRYANTCAGIFFGLHMREMKLKDTDDTHGLKVPDESQTTG